MERYRVIIGKTKSSKFNQIMLGIASTIDLTGSSVKSIRRIDKNDIKIYSSIEDDKKSIAGDWKAVGNDIYKSINKFDKLSIK